MTGRTVVITGASSGIGASAAATLAGRGWQVAVVGRNPERTHAVADRVGGTAFLADFDRLDDVRALADDLLSRYPRIDVLANNAGGLVSKRGLSADGNERTLQHNHLAPFLLTALLRPRIEQAGGRVIGTASVANTFGSLRLDDLGFARRPWFGGWRAYGTAKIMTILFMRELARRSPLEAYSFHPGYVATAFGSGSLLVRASRLVSPNGLGISVERGAAPLVHLAATDDVGAPNGTYFDGLSPGGRTARAARDDDLAARLWQASERLIGSPAASQA